MSESRSESAVESAGPVSFRGGPMPSMNEMSELASHSSVDNSFHMADNNMEFRTAGSSIMDDIAPHGNQFEDGGWNRSSAFDANNGPRDFGDMQSQARTAIDNAFQNGAAGDSSIGQLENSINSLESESQNIANLIQNLIQEIQNHSTNSGLGNLGCGAGIPGETGSGATPPESGMGGYGCGNISQLGSGNTGGYGNGEGSITNPGQTTTPPETGIGGSGCGNISQPGNGNTGGGCGGGETAITNPGQTTTPPETGIGGSGCGNISQLGNGNTGGGCGGGETTITNPGTTGTASGNPADAIVQVIANDGAVAGGEEVSEGSGFFVTSSGGIITDYHVVEGSQGPIEIVLPNGETVEAQVAKTDEADDLALLQVVGGTNGEFPTLQLASDADASATDTDYGHPGGDAQLLETSGAYEGQTSFNNFDIEDISSEDPGFNFNREGDLFDMNIQPGDSGSPILNSSGQVVSIVDLGSAGCGAGCGNFGVGTPAQDAESLLS